VYTDIFAGELALIVAKGKDFLQVFKWGNIVKMKVNGKKSKGVVLGFPLLHADQFLASKRLPQDGEPPLTKKDVVWVKFASATPVYEETKEKTGYVAVVSNLTRNQCVALCNTKLLPGAGADSAQESEHEEEKEQESVHSVGSPLSSIPFNSPLC
jgi:hypothetical protein